MVDSTAVQPLEKEHSRTPFRGDETHNLPKGMREPYRLWFEFLKAALTDSKVSVNREIYADWGDVENADFKSWWESHWRDLFAVPRESVAVLRFTKEVTAEVADSRYLVVRVPVSLQPKRRYKELQRAIETELGSNPRPKPKPRFAISNRVTVHGSVLRGMLKLYQLSLENARNLEATAIAYHDWAKAWNDKITKKKWKRKKTYVPPFLPDLIKAVRELKGATTKAAQRKARSDYNYHELRNRMKRYIRQAETIAKNTGQGIFPGKFDK